MTTLVIHIKKRAMKKIMLTLVGILFATASVSALSYEESRNRAWSLTDKMAYELNLTPEQYDRAYEINLNYFLNVNYPSDIDGLYWRYRNQDLGYVLFDWQFSRFAGISYFYRPLIWRSGICIMTTYDYYDRGFFYFNRPAIYNVYRGVSWHKRPKHNPYRRMTFSANGGMRERYGNDGHGYYFRNGERFDAPRYNGEHYGRKDFRRNPGPDFDKDMMVKPGNNRNSNKVYGNGGNFRDKIENGGRNDNFSKPATDRNDDRFKNNIPTPGNNDAKPEYKREDNNRFVSNPRDNFNNNNIRTSGNNTRNNYSSTKTNDRNVATPSNRFGTRSETSGSNGTRSFSDRIRSSSSSSRTMQSAPASSQNRTASPSVRNATTNSGNAGTSGGGTMRKRSFGR